MRRPAAGRGARRTPAPQPFQPPAPVRPGTLPRAAFPPPPAPRHPDAPTRSSRPTAAPPPGARTAAGMRSLQGPEPGCIRRADAHSPSPPEARPRGSSSPSPLTARRGQAPRRSGGGSQMAARLLAAPLPPSCRPALGGAPPFPGPSSSLECCERQARSRGQG